MTKSDKRAAATRTRAKTTPKKTRQRALRTAPPPLVQSRADTASMLASSLDKIRRLERKGYLRPIRFGPPPASPVYHRCEDVLALVDRLANGEVIDI